jgi:hypothetical protein
MSKLIIHETDNHGCGTVYYNGKTEPYAYDLNADMRGAVEVLVELGVLKEDDVVVLEGEEIYTKLADLLEVEDAYYDKVLDEVDPDYAYEEFEIEGEEEAE